MSRLDVAAVFLGILSLSLVGSLACSDVHNYLSENPPGTGAFNPGGGGPGGYGYGANTNTGGSGGDPGPPQCDDELKRCAHTFTLAKRSELTAELRGDWAADS